MEGRSMASQAQSGPQARTAPQAAGARSTRQKRALAALLTESTGFRSAQDFYADLRHRGENVGLTTIYNQLGALAEAGEVDAVRTETGEMLFRRCATAEHHHHLLCRSCGRTVEVEGPEVERWADRVARTHGFVDVTHTLEVVGLCPECGAS